MIQDPEYEQRIPIDYKVLINGRVIFWFYKESKGIYHEIK